MGDRGGLADRLRDTLMHLLKPKVPEARWETAVPNGIYDVRMVSGDPANFDSMSKLDVEGATAEAPDERRRSVASPSGPSI